MKWTARIAKRAPRGTRSALKIFSQYTLLLRREREGLVSFDDVGDGGNRDAFQAEINQLLSLIINTFYSNRDLSPGALVSHAFELDSKVQTLFYGAPAVFTFRVPTKAALQEAYSTPILPLDILADKPTEKKFDLRLLAQYGSLVSVISIVTLFIYLLASPSSGNANGGKKEKALII